MKVNQNREDVFKMEKSKTIINNGYAITSVYLEVLFDILTSETPINWNNFNNEDYYCTADDEEFRIDNIDHENKTLTIIE